MSARIKVRLIFICDTYDLQDRLFVLAVVYYQRCCLDIVLQSLMFCC